MYLPIFVQGVILEMVNNVAYFFISNTSFRKISLFDQRYQNIFPVFFIVAIYTFPVGAFELKMESNE